MDYAELHFHLLPAIDDGPSSMEDSVALAAAAAAEGTRTIVTTPHVNPEIVTDPERLPDHVHELRARLAAERIPIEVVCGGELDVRMVGRLSDPQLETIAHGPAGRRWVLLEAPLQGVNDYYNEAADELRRRGFAVVVAHPERGFGDPVDGWRVVEYELNAGSALQINAWSLAGVYGEEMQSIAMALLRRAPRVVVASDAHGGARMPSLRLAVDTLTHAGVADAERLVSAAPYRLLEQGLAVAPDALAA